MYHLLLLLFTWAHPSASVPSGPQLGPHTADMSSVIFDHFNTPSPLSYTSEIAGGNVTTWSADRCEKASTMAGGSTELSQSNKDMERRASIDNVKYKYHCFKNRDLLVLTQHDMFLKVEELISDISADGRRGSWHWADHLPGNEDIFMEFYVDLWTWQPPVNAALLRDMLRVLIYSYSCSKEFGTGKTQGGRISASRRLGDDMYARIEVCAM
jgi:hypothetical protein